MNSAKCVKCGQVIEFRAVDAAGRESYWFHKDVRSGTFKRHNARPAKVAA